MKFHTNHNGDISVCKSLKGRCPFGGEEEHHSTREGARKVFENQMAGSFDKKRSQKSEAFSSLERLSSLTPGERAKHKEELRELYSKTTGIPISWDGYLFVGKEPAPYGNPMPSHLAKLHHNGDSYSVKTEAITYTDRGTTRRGLKSLSGRDLSLNEALDFMTKAAKRYGVAEQAQKNVNEMP